MTQYIWKNRAFGTLAAAITNSQTTITLSSGQGALFPSPVSPQVFTLVLQSATNSTLYEITYCTGRSGDTLTLERAQEGTTGLAFNAGDLAQNLVTAGALDYGDYFPTGLGAITANTTLTGASAGNYYNVGGSAETFISLNAATFTVGQTIGFLAQQVAGISTTSGTFYGGSLSGSSFTMPIGSFVALQWDGINWRQLAGAFSRGRLIGTQIFAASGTYTPTNGMSNVIFEVQGGGSAGTGATGATGSNVSMGSPGMAGAYAKGIFTAAMIGASQPVIVGAGGTGVTGSTGNSGGTSSVGALIAAPGGIAVSTLTNQVPPSANGNGLYSSAPSGANIVSILGSASTVSLGLSSTLGLGGAGGRSQFGDGGPGVAINAVGSNAVNPGSGGSGVVVNASGGTIPGGNGAPGIVIAWEYS